MQIIRYLLPIKHLHMKANFFLIIIMLFGFNTCGAQSIIGKWQRDLTKWYQLDKTTGKQVPVSPDVQKQFEESMATRDYKEILEIKSDGTYTSTVSAGGETKVHSEHYTLSGKNLDLNIPLVKGEKTSITIETLTATQMTWNLVFMNRLTGLGYKRIGG
jgi:hypothetical protein